MKFQFLLLLFLTTKNVYAEIELKYDRFKDWTVVTTFPASGVMRAEYAIVPEWIGLFKGQNPTKVPDFVMLQFWKINKSWQYLSCHSVSLLADGVAFPSPTSKHSGNVGRGHVTEIIKVQFSHADVTKLSEAKSIEYRICNTESRLSESDMQDLREFIKATTP